MVGGGGIGSETVNKEKNKLKTEEYNDIFVKHLKLKICNAM